MTSIRCRSALLNLALVALLITALGATWLPTAAHAGVARVNAPVLNNVWGGYTVSFVNPDPQNYPLAVSTAWTVPAVSCTRNLLPISGEVSVWAGLGGTGSNDLEQTGTDSQCINGKAMYWAWEELVPSSRIRCPSEARNTR